MSALTAGLALIPLAIAVEESGTEIQPPITQVIFGGLFNIVVIPALLVQFEEGGKIIE